MKETARIGARFATFFASERQAYEINRDNAVIIPSDYMSIVMDCADQSALGIYTSFQ